MPHSRSIPAQAEQLHLEALQACTQGDNVRALQCFVQSIALAPGFAMAHRNLGELCRRLGRLDDAVLAGQHAVALEPRDADAHANLGLALADQGAWGPAIASYQQALSISPHNGWVWNNLGAALLQSGQATGAEQAFHRAIDLNQAHSEAHINLGLLLQHQGHSAAQTCFARAEAASPGILQRLGISPNPAPPHTPPPAPAN